MVAVHAAIRISGGEERMACGSGLAGPSEDKTFVGHLYNVGPTSSTLVRHCINVIQMFCVCWDGLQVTHVIHFKSRRCQKRMRSPELAGCKIIETIVLVRIQQKIR